MNKNLSEAIIKLTPGWWRTKNASISFSNIFKGYILGLMISGLFSGRRQTYLYSGFLFIFDNITIWFTAGHITDNIKKIMSSTPIEEYIERWLDWENCIIADSIPVNFNEFHVFSGWENNYDLGLYVLSPIESRIIAKNTNSICFNMKHVSHLEVFQPEGFYLFGFPINLREETNSTTQTTLKSPLVCVPIERIPFSEDLPFENPDPSLFYGKVIDFLDSPETIYEIPGMSGGPIIGFKRDSVNGLDYRLYAIQSNWLPKSRIIQAIPITTPIKWFETMKISSF